MGTGLVLCCRTGWGLFFSSVCSPKWLPRSYILPLPENVYMCAPSVQISVFACMCVDDCVFIDSPDVSLECSRSGSRLFGARIHMGNALDKIQEGYFTKNVLQIEVCHGIYTSNVYPSMLAE